MQGEGEEEEDESTKQSGGDFIITIAAVDGVKRVQGLGESESHSLIDQQLNEKKVRKQKSQETAIVNT